MAVSCQKTFCGLPLSNRTDRCRADMEPAQTHSLPVIASAPWRVSVWHLLFCFEALDLFLKWQDDRKS